MNSEKLKGHILILITNILFAVNMPISKYLLPAHVPPEGLTIMRMAFACVMFWIVSLFTVKEKVPLKDLGMLFVCALCGVGINQGLFIVGLNRSSPVDASIIATAVPIFVLLLAAVILKEPNPEEVVRCVHGGQRRPAACLQLHACRGQHQQPRR